jgi:serine/threonine-protein kinase
MSIDAEWIAEHFPELTDIEPLPPSGQKWVFGARHPLEGSIVVKVVKPTEDAERVRREVDAIAQVASSRVPRVLATGTVSTEVGDCVWIRETRVNGQSLRELLGAGPLGRDELMTLGGDVLETLVAAEQVHLVHRDVKPGNIIRDGTGAYWLLDFGLVRHTKLESVTPSEWAFGVGTPGYSAPEQMRNFKRMIDSRADLFACGVVLYESATGTNPFVEGTTTKIERLQRAETLPLSLLALPFDPDGHLGKFVACLTQKYRDRRPRTAAEARDWYNEIRSALGS